MCAYFFDHKIENINILDELVPNDLSKLIVSFIPDKKTGWARNNYRHVVREIKTARRFKYISTFDNIKILKESRSEIRRGIRTLIFQELIDVYPCVDYISDISEMLNYHKLVEEGKFNYKSYSNFNRKMRELRETTDYKIFRVNSSRDYIYHSSNIIEDINYLNTFGKTKILIVETLEEVCGDDYLEDMIKDMKEDIEREDKYRELCERELSIEFGYNYD